MTDRDGFFVRPRSNSQMCVFVTPTFSATSCSDSPRLRRYSAIRSANLMKSLLRSGIGINLRRKFVNVISRSGQALLRIVRYYDLTILGGELLDLERMRHVGLEDRDHSRRVVAA